MDLFKIVTNVLELDNFGASITQKTLSWSSLVDFHEDNFTNFSIFGDLIKCNNEFIWVNIGIIESSIKTELGTVLTEYGNLLVSISEDVPQVNFVGVLGHSSGFYAFQIEKQTDLEQIVLRLFSDPGRAAKFFKALSLLDGSPVCLAGARMSICCFELHDNSFCAVNFGQ